MELSCEVVSCLGPVASMELRCVSQKLLDLVDHRLLQRAAESWTPDSTTEPLCERVRVATTCGEDLAIAVLTAFARPALDETNVHGQTALMWAAGHGCAPLCSLLLAEGALTEAVDSGGWTALFRAAWHGRRAAISVLIRAGADVDCNRAKYTPLMAAARFGHAAVVQRLLLAGALSGVGLSTMRRPLLPSAGGARGAQRGERMHPRTEGRQSRLQLEEKVQIPLDRSLTRHRAPPPPSDSQGCH